MKTLSIAILSSFIILMLIGAGITLPADPTIQEVVLDTEDLEIIGVTYTVGPDPCNWIYWEVTVKNIGTTTIPGTQVLIQMNLNGIGNVGFIICPDFIPGEVRTYYPTSIDLADGTYTDISANIIETLTGNTYPDDNTINNVYPLNDITIDCEPDIDLGDAPEGDGAIAYPSTMTYGSFPTCIDCGPAGYISHATKGAYFGESVDFEVDGNGGTCPVGFPPYDMDECYNDGDAGLIIPEPYTILSGAVVPCPGGSGTPLGFAGQTVHWGPDIDIYVRNMPPSDTVGFVNVLMDWNQDGDWDDVGEHVLVDHDVPSGFMGKLSELFPPAFTIGQNPGYVWTRFTITDVQLGVDWSGDGVFHDGETEDYLLEIIEQPNGEALYMFYPNANIPSGCEMIATDGITSYFDIELFNVPPGFDMGDGIYNGWCFEKAVEMTRGMLHPVHLCHSYDPNMPAAFKSANWDMVNYLINHKNGYSMEDVQDAIWWILEGFTPTSSTALELIADVEANGNNYCPVQGDLLAVLVYLDDTGLPVDYPPVQNTFIEVPLNYSACPAEFWVNNPGDWPAGFDPSQMLSMYFAVDPGHDMTLMDALLIPTWNEPFYYPDSTILSNPTALRQNLLKQAVTGLLSTNHLCVHYPMTYHQLLVLINDVLYDHWDMYIVNLWLSMYNHLDCPDSCCPCAAV